MTPVHRKALALLAAWPLLVLAILFVKHWQWPRGSHSSRKSPTTERIVVTLEGVLFVALAYGLPILGAIVGTAMAITCRIQNGHWR